MLVIQKVLVLLLITTQHFSQTITMNTNYIPLFQTPPYRTPLFRTHLRLRAILHSVLSLALSLAYSSYSSYCFSCSSELSVLVFLQPSSVS